MTELVAFFGYNNLSLTSKCDICNGAGAKNDWRSSFIPNTLYGLNCVEAFNIHDHAYEVGRTLHDKKFADDFLLCNLLELINTFGGWLRWFRRRRALKYYEAVYEAGSDSFFTELKHHSDTLGYQDGRRFDMVHI